jgi:hypothetical protein
MGGDDDAPVCGGLFPYGVHPDIQGIDQVVFHLPLDIVLLVHIDLIPGTLGIVGKRGKEAVGKIPKGQGPLQGGKEAKDMDLFLGGGLHAEKGDNAQGPAYPGKGGTVKAGIMIRQGQDLYPPGGG